MYITSLLPLRTIVLIQAFEIVWADPNGATFLSRCLREQKEALTRPDRATRHAHYSDTANRFREVLF